MCVFAGKCLCVCIQYTGCESVLLSSPLFPKYWISLHGVHMRARLLSHILTIFSGTVVQWLTGSMSIHQEQLVLCVQPPPAHPE